MSHQTQDNRPIPELEESVKRLELVQRERELRDTSSLRNRIGSSLIKGLPFVLPILVAVVPPVVGWMKESSDSVEKQNSGIRGEINLRKQATYQRGVDVNATLVSSVPGTSAWKKAVEHFDQAYWVYLPLYEDRGVEHAMMYINDLVRKYDTEPQLYAEEKGGTELKKRSLVVSKAMAYSLSRGLASQKYVLRPPEADITVQRHQISLALKNCPPEGALLKISKVSGVDTVLSISDDPFLLYYVDPQHSVVSLGFKKPDSTNGSSVAVPVVLECQYIGDKDGPERKLEFYSD